MSTSTKNSWDLTMAVQGSRYNRAKGRPKVAKKIEQEFLKKVRKNRFKVKLKP